MPIHFRGGLADQISPDPYSSSWSSHRFTPSIPYKHSVLRRMETVEMETFDEVTYTNIPIELSYYIAAYINRVERDDLVKGSTVSVMNSALNSLVECLGGFERILRTPIPLAYSVHLDHAVWLYLLSLPYQLIGTLNWFTIPAVTLASFALLGILGIAWEIENPFGTDDNDLPLDDFCDVIHKEILTIIGHRMTDPKDWLLSDKNQPLLPESSKTAEDLIQMEENAIQELLRKGAKLRLSKEKLSQRNNGTNHVAIPIGTDAIKEEREELRPMINNA
ncbi:unnamed protein product [Orchesella dallaii]|uniref:Bestrophin homolog n=1 Tax=Orchesella dallaii TaxID=48710 RepID=A0ABP1QMT2_9HEXA